MDKYRKKPIQRNKPLPARRQPIKRQRSSSYRRKRNEVFQQHDPEVGCQVRIRPGCMGMATDLHHPEGRIGQKRDQVEKGILCCRYCHQFLEEHPTFARTHHFSHSRM